MSVQWWPSRRARAALLADLRAALRYGWGAPRRYQTIYIDPGAVRHLVRDKARVHGDHMSGAVLDGDWDLDVVPLEDSPWVAGRIQRGASWEELGAYDYMMRAIERNGGVADECRSLEDVKERYARLDRFIVHLASGGGFSTRREMWPGAEREYGGVLIHVGRDELLFSEKGNHRLFIARHLGLAWIPAQLGVVHAEALRNGHFHSLTRRPNMPQAPWGTRPEVIERLGAAAPA